MNLRRLAALALLGPLITLALLVAAASTADAHAVLVSSDPVGGSTLRAAPTQVTLVFDEPVQLVPRTAKVLGPHDALANTPTAAHADGSHVTIPLHPGLARGAYLVTWRIISADGHQIDGSLQFGVRVPAGQSGSAATSGAPMTTLDWAHDVLAGLANGAVVLVIGVPLASAVLRRRLFDHRRVRLAFRVGVVAELVIALVLIHVDAARAGGRGWWSLAFLGRGEIHEHGQQLLVLRIVAVLALAAAALWWTSGGYDERARPTRGPFDALFFSALALVLSHAWIGHASAGSWQFAAVVAAIVHILAAATWIGGLLVLVIAPPDLVRRAWSIVAGTCVAAIAATGVIQALRQVDPLASLWSTRYGVLLLIKAVLLLVAIGLALVARRRLRERESVTGPDLRRRVGVEFGALVIVLAVTGVLQSGQPARDVYGPAVTTTAPLGRDVVRVHADHTRRGPLTLRIVRLSKGREAALEGLTGQLTATGVGELRGTTTLPVTFRRVGTDTWVSTDAQAPFPGRWRLRLDAAISPDLGYATSTSLRIW